MLNPFGCHCYSKNRKRLPDLKRTVEKLWSLPADTGHTAPFRPGRGAATPRLPYTQVSEKIFSELATPVLLYADDARV